MSASNNRERKRERERISMKKLVEGLRHTVVGVQLLLLYSWSWSCGIVAQSPGFLSLDCGPSTLTSNYTDPQTYIEWTSDAHLMTEGQSLPVGSSRGPPFDTMRLFTGNLSKYCYTLSNSAVTPGAFFIVRASFWRGDSQPYVPTTPDRHFHFKLLIDADEWADVNFAYDTDTRFHYEIYTRALHHKIDVCLARTSPNGDPPFISALVLRPLPSSLSATRIMNTINRNFIATNHNYAESSSGILIGYPDDTLDRLWLSYDATNVLQTTATIHTSRDPDEPPVKILQTADPNITTWRYTNREMNGTYYCVFYFAEIDPRVNASGQRVFNIVLNGEQRVNENPVDVFDAVGAFTSYEITSGPISADSRGYIDLNFSATPTSLFPPMLAAAELFHASSNAFSSGSSSTDVAAIEGLKSSMNLGRYTGDPCLPAAYKYEWLTCTNDSSTSTTGPRIESLDLSNYSTGGTFPDTIVTLTTLVNISLKGNNLEGSIPDLTSLVQLEILDLSNNKLSGPIPTSLATLENLKLLNLENNNLLGKIPDGLRGRPSLVFKFSGNAGLCGDGSKSPCPSSSKPKVGLFVGVAIAAVFVLITGVIVTLFFLRKKKPHPTLGQSFFNDFLSSDQNKMRFYSSSDSNSNPVPMFTIQEYTLNEIKSVTNNFNTQIGRGGFGPVYKGILKSGAMVAVKVSSNSSHQGLKEFLNEVGLLSRIHHRNLMGILGFCKEGGLILVYEFMSKGSLFDCLHGEVAEVSPLSWISRLRILVDAAQGIEYLHFGCHPRIIHRDIKSSNILLNENLDAKISDFGISRSNVNANESAAPTTALMGSMGYLDPEYFSNMRLTEKVDVYSFGVLLFEVICGRRVIVLDTSHKESHIVEWVRSHIDRGKIDTIVDVALHGNYNLSAVWKVIDVALACVACPSDQRPNMSTVYSELKEALNMEHQSEQSDMLTVPPISSFKQIDDDTLQLTHVNPR